MDVRETFRMALEALLDRKVRSMLTILMVVVGCGLTVAVNGMTAGFGEFIDRQFTSLATNVLTVTPAQASQQGPGAGGPPPAPKITLNDAVVSKFRSMPFVDDVVPAYSGQVTLQAGGKSRDASVLAIEPQKLYVIAPTLKLTEGSSISPGDPSALIVADSIANPEGENSPFLVLGQTVRATYTFVDEDTGESEDETKSFVVRGIIEPTGNPTIDRAVVMDDSVGNALLQKSGKYDMVMIAAESSDFVEPVEEQIRNLYGNNIGVSTPAAALETRQQFTSGFASFILAIAAVALVVGAVGIVTTLYTSVNERIREIGTLKAIGMQNGSVLLMFLGEAMMIGMVGATVGLAMGIGGGFLLTTGFGPPGGIDISPVYRLQDLATSWLLSVFLSIIAGVYPAWKASKLDPIVALRRE